MKTTEEIDHEISFLLAQREALAAAEAEAPPPEPSLPEPEEWFAERHGGEVWRWPNGRERLFADGAVLCLDGRRYENDRSAGGLWRRFRNVRRTFADDLRISERDFIRFHDSATGRSFPGVRWDKRFTERYGEPPPCPFGQPSAVPLLETIANHVRAQREALAALDQIIAALPEERARQAAIESERQLAIEAADRQAEVARAVQRITI